MRQWNKLHAKIADSEHELDRLRAEVASLNSRLEETKRVADSNMKQMDETRERTVSRLTQQLASLKEERDALRRKIFTNTNGEFTLENRTFSIEGFDFILDNNFDFDAGLNVSGDFGGDEKRHDYMQMICNALNSHYALTQQLAAANGRVEMLRDALAVYSDESEWSAYKDSPWNLLFNSTDRDGHGYAVASAALSNLNEDSGNKP